MHNDWVYELPLASEEELRHFVEKSFGVRIPDKQVCAHHVSPWRAFADAYFARHPIVVWKASRGLGGKSFLLALLGLTEALTLKADVNILGGSGEQSANVLKYVRKFWDYPNAPTSLLSSDIARETRIAWGNSIKALLASQTSVRGPHVPRLRLDEVDEMELEIFDAALGQTMATTEGGKIIVPAQTVASSTHQYPDRTMQEVLRRAARKGWPIREWCFRENLEPHGWLLQSEVERKKHEVTQRMWLVEFELQEPSPEGRAIDSGALEKMFSKELGEFDGANEEYIEIEPPMFECPRCHKWFALPDLEGKGVEIASGVWIYHCPDCPATARLMVAPYSTGVDWAKKQDWTVIATLRTDVYPNKLVAFERCGRLPWPIMAGKLNNRLKRYEGQCCHDVLGLGDVIEEMLDYAVDGVNMIRGLRQKILTEYILAIEGGDLIAPMIRFAYDEHRYATYDDVFGSGHLPDPICALALAHYARAGMPLA